MKQRVLFILLLMLGWGWRTDTVAAERERPFVDEAEAPVAFVEGEAWKEGAIEIPPLPKDDNLIEFQPDAGGRQFRYYIDSVSLAVGKDGVVRYTLVLESRQGVRNFSYEGLRCGTREYKVYAYGSRRGLRPRKAPHWKPIDADRVTGVHRNLHRYYMCEPTVETALEPKRILAALRGQVDIRAINFLKPW